MTADIAETTKPIDPRLKQLSYSSTLLLESCPRKYELTKYNVADNSVPDEKQELDFAFGHMVGKGIQLAFLGIPEDQIIWECFLEWDTDLLNDHARSNKSFWLATLAIQKFIALRKSGFLQDWKVFHAGDKPAVELSFLIDFNEGFLTRGFIDLVLEHKTSGAILVLEIKTDGGYTINDLKYANSSQTFGYSIVLDHLKPGLNSYKVMYLVYSTVQLQYFDFLFNRSNLHKAEWIKNQLLSIETIKMYEEHEHYPKHGQSCMSYNKACRYFGLCSLSNRSLVKPITEAQKEALAKENETYQYRFHILDLIDSQLNK